MLSDLEENGEEGRSVSKQSKKSLTTFAYIQAVFGCVCVYADDVLHTFRS